MSMLNAPDALLQPVSAGYSLTPINKLQELPQEVTSTNKKTQNAIVYHGR